MRYTRIGTGPDRLERLGSNQGAVIRALVFDFDGLVLDVESAEHQACREIYRQHGAELPSVRWGECCRDGLSFDLCEQLESDLGEYIDRAQVHGRRTARVRELLEQRSALPGIRAFVDRARALRMRLGITSNSERRWVERHLEAVGLLAPFHALRCIEDVDRGKPDPMLHRSLLEALEVPAREAIAIEDSPGGIDAAKRAGLYCVSVPNMLTRNLNLDRADLALVSLSDTSLDDVIARASRHLDQPVAAER